MTKWDISFANMSKNPYSSLNSLINSCDFSNPGSPITLTVVKIQNTFKLYALFFSKTYMIYWIIKSLIRIRFLIP